MFFTKKDIFHDIRKALINKTSFSIVRLGDGDLKILRILLKKGYHEKKFKQQGIPNNKKAFQKVLEIYKTSCNNANFISSFDVYFGGEYHWKRTAGRSTMNHMKNWKDVYDSIGITNENYCSPEIGVFLCLRSKQNIFRLMRKRKVCIINCFDSIVPLLNKRGYDVSIFKIPARNGNHYNHYDKLLNKLKNIVDKYDLFLVGGGVFGRGYSDCIKQNGGIAIDIGQVFDFWNNEKQPKRIKGLVEYHPDKMDFTLTKKGEMFKGGI